PPPFAFISVHSRTAFIGVHSRTAVVSVQTCPETAASVGAGPTADWPAVETSATARRPVRHSAAAGLLADLTECAEDATVLRHSGVADLDHAPHPRVP